jgi:TolB protein
VKKLFPVLSALVLIAFAMALVNCGNEHHSILTNQFAFIREASGSGLIANTREVKGVRRLHQQRMTQRGVGLRPWAVEIDPGTDSVVIMNNDGSGEVVAVNQGGWFYSIQVGIYGNKVSLTADITTNGTTNEQVLMASGSGNDYTNYTVTQLTSDAEDHYQAQLSADGKKMVFIKYNSTAGTDQAYVVSTSGGAETAIPTPDNVEVVSPTFTPDGKSIVFEDCNLDSIDIVNLDGTDFKVLHNADGTVQDDTPGVSPDGKLITFLSEFDVYTMDMNGGSVKQLTTDGLSDDPMFVNNKIVFLSYRDNMGSSEIYSMSTDGSNQKRLTNNSFWEWFQDYDMN